MELSAPSTWKRTWQITRTARSVRTITRFIRRFVLNPLWSLVKSRLFFCAGLFTALPCSFLLRTRPMQATPARDASANVHSHVHIGAGSFGLGMVVPLCRGAGFKTAILSREGTH